MNKFIFLLLGFLWQVVMLMSHLLIPYKPEFETISFDVVQKQF
jgi:hypothetical protein